MKIKYLIFNMYVVFCIINYKIRVYLFNTEYANKIFYTINRNAIPKILRHLKASIGHNTHIDSPLILHYKNNDLSKLKIGNNCNLSKNCFLDLAEKITIEDNCTIAMNTTIITHLDIGNSSPTKNVMNNKRAVILRKGTYIGANCTILKGVSIGKCCFIGAKSLVTKNISNNSFAYGNPAKIIE